jgi:hypothetical protein
MVVMMGAGNRRVRVAGVHLSFVAAVLLLASPGGSSEEYNIKRILEDRTVSSGEEIIGEVREVIELYRSIREWQCHGVEWKRNIFRPLISEPPDTGQGQNSEAESGEAETLFLEGIFIGEGGRSALINGKMVEEGDRIAGFVLVSISLDRLVLKSGSSRRELSLDD